MATPKQIERLNRILKTALLEFSQKGYHEANVDEIARRASVGKGTLYRHYANKEGLFLAVFDNILNTLERSIREQSDFSTFEKGARSAIRIYMQQFKENPDVFLFFKIFSTEPQIADGMLKNKLNDRYITGLVWAEEEVRRAQRSEQISKRFEADRLVFAALGMIHFLVYQWIRNGCVDDLLKNADMTCDIIFHGISTSTPRRPRH